ncbi:MAG TPA: response regulator, partial [Terriglobales bacterium]|nr:response regulator [Terriglobales bacterium]
MKTVLVIDDEEGIRTLMAAWLSAAGWNVLEASDGEGGIDLALQHQPNAVVCDLLLPRCNGFQVCRSIREQGNTIQQPKIIVTTGSGYITDQESAMEVGADEYLIKPFRADQLVKLLERESVHPAVVAAAPIQPPKALTRLFVDHTPRLRFWGVRGSIPTPGPATVEYGGNTSCVEVRADGEIIILDAGSGIRRLGLALAGEFKDQSLNLTLLITHTHWDHIQGF